MRCLSGSIFNVMYVTLAKLDTGGDDLIAFISTLTHTSPYRQLTITMTNT